MNLKAEKELIVLSMFSFCQSLSFKRWTHQVYQHLETLLKNSWIKQKGNQQDTPRHLWWNSSEKSLEVTTT